MIFEKYKGKEEPFQKALARYLDVSKLLWFHAPNEIKAKPKYMEKRKAQGVKSGFPDVGILESNKFYKGLFIELKVGYNQPSENQKKWIDNLNSRGYCAFVSYSLDECISVIERYLLDKEFKLKTNQKTDYHNYLLEHKKTD